jgi:hypothetical protein
VVVSGSNASQLSGWWPVSLQESMYAAEHAVDDSCQRVEASVQQAAAPVTACCGKIAA